MARTEPDDTRTTTAQRMLTASFFILAIIAIISPITFFATAITSTFSSSINVTAVAPTIAVDTGQSIGSIPAGTSTVYVFFNATSQNGWGSLNDTSATVVLNKTGETTRTSTSCTAISHPDANTNRYNCSLTLYYYDASGPWTINASIKDLSNNYYQNTTVTLNVGTLDSITLVSPSLNFTGSPGTNNIASNPTSQKVNNTGNQNYNNGLNITALSFASGTNIIGASNVTMNITASGGAGQSLINNTLVGLTGSNLSKGPNNIRDVYFYLSIPASTPAGSYAAQGSWTVSAS